MRAPQRRRAAGRGTAAHRWFFPAALTLALVEIPLWTAAYAGWIAWPPLASDWHGHEMLFGYALAVVAGFLLARIGRTELVTLLGAWILARVVAPHAGSRAVACRRGRSLPAAARCARGRAVSARGEEGQ